LRLHARETPSNIWPCEKSAKNITGCAAEYITEPLEEAGRD